MNPASVLSLSCATLALCVAAFHAWLYWLQHRDRADPWLAAAALATAAGGLATAFLYDSQDVLRSDWLQRGVLLSSAVFLLGFARYSLLHLAAPPPTAARAIAVFCAAFALVAIWPGLVFDGVPVERRIDLLGVRYVQSTLGASGGLVLLAFLPASVYLLRLYADSRGQDAPDRRALWLMAGGWAAVSLNDLGVGLGWHQGPLLLEVGQTVVLITFSSVQVRKLVRALFAGERSAEQLAELVDRRTVTLRERELQLLHGEQMATIGTLVAGLAHEINNPIAYVSSNLNRIDEAWERDADAEEVDEMLAECQEGIDRIRSLCWSLLTLARRSDGVDEPVELRMLIDATMPVVRREAEPRAVLETEVEDGLRVSGDPRLLGHVVLSLTMNALRTIPTGAPDRNRVRISSRREQDRAVLSVSSTGGALRSEPLPGVLAPILAAKPDRGTTGLGLGVTRQIVERHQGEIDVASDERGTTVTVRLPAL